MTTKHLADGLMQSTRARSHNACTELLGLPQGLLCRMSSGKRPELKVSTLVHIHERSGVSLDMLVSWYRMPAEKVLGRINLQEVRA